MTVLLEDTCRLGTEARTGKLSGTGRGLILSESGDVVSAVIAADSGSTKYDVIMCKLSADSSSCRSFLPPRPPADEYYFYHYNQEATANQHSFRGTINAVALPRPDGSCRRWQC